MAKPTAGEIYNAPSDSETDAPYSVTWWFSQISHYDRAFREWQLASDKLLRLYAKQKRTEEDTRRRFAMLYANSEVLKPTIYSRPPVPQVSRRYKDPDPVGRKAAELLERSCSYEIERQGIDNILRQVRDDVVLPGRGSVWVRYEADIDPQTSLIGSERVPVDYVNWRDFGHMPARTWDEVDGAWRKVYYSRQQAKVKFGAKIAEALTYSHKPDRKNVSSQQDQVWDGNAKAICYEIWCKADGNQYLIAKEYTDFLRPPGPVPLDFEGFWPFPRPAYSLLTTDNLIPTPDYKHYQDQAEEIDDLTARIAKLTDGLKLVGFYPSGAGQASLAIERAMDPTVENVLIPVENWQTFAEHGGKDAIVWMRLKEVVDTITACVSLRSQLIQDVYQISGISDILRGATNPNETLGAQQLKSQWGSVRIKDRQMSMANFARDVCRLVCEVIAEHFEPSRILAMANMLGTDTRPQQSLPSMSAQPGAGMNGLPPAPQPAPGALTSSSMTAPPTMPGPAMGGMFPAPPPPDTTIPQALQLLRDEKTRGFRIDIETDSTIMPDENEEKQRRTEFLGVIASFMDKAMPVVQMQPALMPLMGEVLLFTARGYRAGRMLEDSIEQAVSQMTQQAEAAKNAPPPPDPNMERVKQDGQIAQDRLRQDQQSGQAKLQSEQMLSQEQMRADLQKHAMELASKEKIATMDAQVQDQKHQRDVKAQGVMHVQGLEAANTQAMAGPQQNDKQFKTLMQIMAESKKSNDAMISQLGQQSMALVQATQMLAKSLLAPKTVTTPDGRTYTSRAQN